MPLVTLLESVKSAALGLCCINFWHSEQYFQQELFI